MSKIFTAELSEFTKIITYIKDMIIKLGFDNKTANVAHIVCDELITNIIKNSYPADKPDTHIIANNTYIKPLQILCSKKTNDSISLVIELTDWGIHFDPHKHQPSKKAGKFEGGVGISIAKALTDHIKYTRKNNKNILRIYIISKQ